MFALIAKTIIGSIFGSGMDMLKDWLEKKHTLDQIRAESVASIEKARAEAEVKRLTADIDWEAEMARQAGTSWKDEFWTILLAAPIVFIFIPGLQGYVITGFDALKAVPDWYLLAVGTAIAAAFGTKAIIGGITKWKDK